jgi:hypothetical protein
VKTRAFARRIGEGLFGQLQGVMRPASRSAASWESVLGMMRKAWSDEGISQMRKYRIAWRIQQRHMGGPAGPPRKSGHLGQRLAT